MKERIIIALVLSVSIYAVAGTDAVGDELKEGAFGKYYEPYEPNIEPNAPGYTLPLDLNDIVNLADAEKVTDVETISDNLRQNGFAIIEPLGLVWDDDDIVEPYEYISTHGIPIFLTTDTLLHLYHIQFDETLKDIEEREFIRDINDLTLVLLNDSLGLYEQIQGELKEAARRNVAYLAVAQKLIDPNARIPALVTELVTNELAKIDAHAGFAPSDIFIYQEDYSQYVPRGHYTRSQELRRYFRTLMWYGRMAFLLKGSIPWGQNAEALISPYDAKIQTLQAILLAASLQRLQVGDRLGLQVWDRIYSVTAFYVGLADDLTPYDYLWALNQVFGGDFVLNDLVSDDNLLALKTELALLPSPKIYGGTGNVFVTPPVTPESLDEVLDKTKGMRFMGQRFIPDSYMFQHLVFPEVLDYTGTGDPVPFTLGDTGLGPGRGYPRGLDVMALLGSKQALHILIDEGDTDYIGFWRQFGEMKYEFDAFTVDDWNQNLYWSWLYSLKALVMDFPQGYPNFMRTATWQKKSLNATLASWSELRHDTILYAKQSYTPDGKSGGGWWLPPPPGYIEPALEFYGRLLALTRMTAAGLTDMKVLSEQAARRLTRLGELLERMLEINEKELLNQPLTKEDDWYITGLPELLESLVTGVGDAGIKTTLVADVHTNVAEKQVVEEAVGNVDLIVVACPNTDGSVFLAVGPVLSYYEFKHPMSDRLTDEAWRELLDSPDRPNRPKWFQPLMRTEDSSGLESGV